LDKNWIELCQARSAAVVDRFGDGCSSDARPGFPRRHYIMPPSRWLDTSDDHGKASFIQMLDKLRATDEPYPSRQQHIGQALAIAYVDVAPSLQAILRSVEGSTETDLVRKLDQKPPFTSKSYSLYTGPKSEFPKIPGRFQVSSADSATLLLQAGDWYLVRAKNKIGWVATSQ
jgi:hypothetical protein